jgi:hypothetical protein
MRAAIIEECAKVVEPKGPRPCDCERCDCGNRGDMEAVASWDTDAYNAKAIRALAEPVDRYEEAMAAIDACIGPAHNGSFAGNGDEWRIDPSIPADGFECFYLLRNGVTVAEIDGYQTEERTRHLNELVAAANAHLRAVPQTFPKREDIGRAIYDVAVRWVEPNFPKGHKLRPFEQLDERETTLHLEYADAVLELLASSPLSRPHSPGE